MFIVSFLVVVIGAPVFGAAQGLEVGHQRLKFFFVVRRSTGRAA